MRRFRCRPVAAHSAPGARPAQPPPGQKKEGDGGEHLTGDHAQDDEPHGALRILGEEEHQQAQHRPGADKLLAQLHSRGGADAARAVEIVLVQVLHPGEQDAGQQEQQPQLGAGVPQQVHRDGVIEHHHHRRHGGEQQEEARQAAAEHLPDHGGAAHGVVLGGQVGHRRRQPHGGEGEEDGEHRHDQLVEPHHLRADEPGEEDAVDEAEKLGDDAGERQHQRAVEHGRAVEFQGAAPFRAGIRDNYTLFTTGCPPCLGKSFDKPGRSVYDRHIITLQYESE